MKTNSKHIKNFSIIILVMMIFFRSADAQTLSDSGSVSSVMSYDTLTSYSKRARLPKALRECSGITFTSSGKIWMHNDSGNLPVLYAVDQKGHITKELKVTGGRNFDWEDITTDQDGYIYLGDFGNNKSRRKVLQIYKLPDPDTVSTDHIAAEKIEFRLMDMGQGPIPIHKQNFDIEAMFHYNDSLVLVTKNHSKPSNGYAKIYKLPVVPGKYNLQPLDSIFLGTGPAMQTWVTGAAINPEEDKVVLLSHDKIWVIQDFKGKKFSDSRITQYMLPTYSQKEGICFIGSDEILITDELFQGILGGEMLFIRLRK